MLAAVAGTVITRNVLVFILTFLLSGLVGGLGMSLILHRVLAVAERMRLRDGRTNNNKEKDEK